MIQRKARPVKMPENSVSIGVLASGGGTNLQAIIDSIEAGQCAASIKVVVSDNPAAGALKRAEAHGIPTATVDREGFKTREAFDEEIIGILNGHGVELVALAGFMRILSPGFIRSFPMRIMNIHPALLPSFPGLNVQKAAIEHGVKFSGCTVHFVDEGCDTGPIIIQATVPVLDDDTVESLSERILSEEHRIYPQAIQLYSEGRLKVVGRRVLVSGQHADVGFLENPPVTVFRDD
jgi:phosphoribosylglycinamide formyltransferase-1